MGKYNFDIVHERRGTNSEKWEGMEGRFGSNDLHPMWVADMDFAVLPEIAEAVKHRAAHPIFGYSFRPASWKETIIKWIEKRHDWQISPEWIEFSPGVVPTIAMAILSYTKNGDGILIQPPVYPPFARSISGAARNLVENPLIFNGTKFEMDFENLEQKIMRENVKLALLCNPHNPCGRVWTRDELVRFAEICVRHNVLIFSDEIHADIIYAGHKHIPVASLSAEISDITITAMSPSKTFNIAGLSTSEVIIQNAELRKKFAATLDFVHIGGGNIFGNVASEAAYTHGEEWLDELLQYLEGNVKFVSEYFEKNTELRLVKPEGTYVPFIDCSKFGVKGEEMHKIFVEKMKIAMSGGYTFGTGGENFMRINIAAPRKILEIGLEKIEKWEEK